MEEILFRMKREVIEDVAIIGGLVGMQFVYAGNAVLLSYVMSLGLNPLTIVIFSTLSTFIVLSPIAAYFERHTWPKKISLKFLIQLLLIALGGVTLFQTLFLKGIQLTSPAMAAAMPNLAPGFIFVIACTVRLERVKISCLYSKMKILGTILCVVGAITMSVMQSTASPSEAEAQPQFRALSPESLFDKQKIIGCLYLLAAVFVLSSNIVLQATTLGDFPAPISLCAITSLIGVFLTAAVQFIQDHKIETGWPLVSAKQLIGFSLLGGVVSGACVSFNGWAMKKRGPVLVSMFSPIGTVCSVVLSVITLGDAISVGSFAGMCLMFTGLYFFLWAKGKEGYLDVRDLESEFDAEKPLLC
ncbi:WAT1-related protein At5g47470-like [Pyrus communis]|uniref:WAT1-related protein At5g47470-like n=1 Tax=Pyrus communis TaxID=23211 RepID=UPI0035BF3581